MSTLVGPQTPSSATEAPAGDGGGARTLRRVRYGIDALAAALLLSGGEAAGVIVFWGLSHLIFPYPQWAERARSNPRLWYALIVWGVGMAGLSHYWLRLLPAHLCDSLGLVLTGLAHRAYLQQKPGAELSASHLYLGLAALAAGLAAIALRW